MPPDTQNYVALGNLARPTTNAEYRDREKYAALGSQPAVSALLRRLFVDREPSVPMSRDAAE